MSWRLKDPKFLKRNWLLRNNAIEEVVGDDGAWTVGTEAYRDNGYGKSMGDFDGADSMFTVGNSSIVQDLFSGGATISCLVIADSDGEGNEGKIVSKISGYYLGVQNEGSGKVEIIFAHDFTDTDGTWSTTSACLNIGEPTVITVAYNSVAVGNDPIIYVGRAMPALTEDLTPVGTATNDTNDFIIGNYQNQSRTFDGGIGDIRIYQNDTYGCMLTWDEHLELCRIMKR